jgi:hypothetical protein
MFLSDDLASHSLVMSIGIAMIALFLGLQQWYLWRARATDLSALDRRYFLRQDLRRGLGVAILLLLALGISAGSRVKPKVAGHVNLFFLEIWLAVVVLVLALLALAFWDWLAIRSYASRQRQSMVRERLELLDETYRLAARRRSHQTGEQKTTNEEE